MLDRVEFVRPDIRHTGSLDQDLGGDLIVELQEVVGAHSRSAQAARRA
jgi:hypothetical protein